jgi:hypothetical protein
VLTHSKCIALLVAFGVLAASLGPAGSATAASPNTPAKKLKRDAEQLLDVLKKKKKKHHHHKKHHKKKTASLSLTVSGGGGGGGGGGKSGGGGSGGGGASGGGSVTHKHHHHHHHHHKHPELAKLKKFVKDHPKLRKKL